MNKNKITAVLGPTNTGKTHLAIETMLSFDTGMIGFPLRLLAREVYDKVIKKTRYDEVALITGEEKIIPSNAKYFLCTVESMPIDKDLEFVGVDEIQMCADHERGHIFTDRLLNMRGSKLTMFMGSNTIKGIVSKLNDDIEFIDRKRLSKLTYSGHKKISRINRKTAIIAFSTEEVYAIAELIRRQKGGAAIVMGSLSPKTRNAQVDLYQSGDVDFLVATDAIGMGINMDLDQVYFSNLKKFDGKKLRKLNLSEIGQIAGRAGRYLNDGNFGITGDCKEITAEEVELLENHKFENIRTLFWRNSDLNFNNPVSLLKSLEEKPSKDWLRKIHECEDEKVLKYFLKKAYFLLVCLIILNLYCLCFNSLKSFVKFLRSEIIKLNLKFIDVLVFSIISTLEILISFCPTKEVTSPKIPGLSGSDTHNDVLYFLSICFVFSLYCQYFLIAERAFPVLVDESQ